MRQFLLAKVSLKQSLECLAVSCLVACHLIYGVLPGKIASISFVPYNKSYAVEVAFPEGLTTTNHKEIKYEIDLSGKAEIITSSRSILSRIFAPIYELFKEK